MLHVGLQRVWQARPGARKCDRVRHTHARQVRVAVRESVASRCWIQLVLDFDRAQVAVRSMHIIWRKYVYISSGLLYRSFLQN